MSAILICILAYKHDVAVSLTGYNWFIRIKCKFNRAPPFFPRAFHRSENKGGYDADVKMLNTSRKYSAAMNDIWLTYIDVSGEFRVRSIYDALCTPRSPEMTDLWAPGITRVRLAFEYLNFLLVWVPRKYRTGRVSEYVSARVRVRVSVSDICALTFKDATLTGEEAECDYRPRKRKDVWGGREGEGAAESESF